jgi:hypothetical protein
MFEDEDEGEGRDEDPDALAGSIEHSGIVPAILYRSGPPKAGFPGADTTPVLTQQNRPAACA